MSWEALFLVLYTSVICPFCVYVTAHTCHGAPTQASESSGSALATPCLRQDLSCFAAMVYTPSSLAQELPGESPCLCLMPQCRVQRLQIRTTGKALTLVLGIWTWVILLVWQVLLHPLSHLSSPPCAHFYPLTYSIFKVYLLFLKRRKFSFS